MYVSIYEKLKKKVIKATIEYALFLLFLVMPYTFFPQPFIAVIHSLVHSVFVSNALGSCSVCCCEARSD